MKSITKLFVIFLFSFFYSQNSIAQTSGITYQAVVRNSSNALVSNTLVGFKISITKWTYVLGAGTYLPTLIYSERQTPTTNINGLATFVIGNGTVLSGIYSTNNWYNSEGYNYYTLTTETDPTGGTNYTIVGTSTIKSVPMAEYAQKASTSFNLDVPTGTGAGKVYTTDARGNASFQTLVSANANTGLNANANITQAIPNGVFTKVNFGSETTDDANAYNPTTGQWTVPSTGFYHIYSKVRIDNTFPAGSYAAMALYVNFSSVKENRQMGAVIYGDYDISADLKLNAGDVVTIFMYQGSGASATIHGSAQDTYFSAFRVY